MAYWLYQMDANEWPHERYRNEVWEGSVTQNWGVGKTKPSEKKPQPGDTIVFLYVRTNAPDPGIYGWGIVSWCDGEEIHFRPVFPSDYLKVNPVPEVKVAKIVDNLRGGMKMGTMWELEQKLFDQFRQKIAKHVQGITSKTGS